MTTTLGLFGNFGPMEIGIILMVGLLLFGRRLPEVGRGLGKSIVEFKKGLRDVTDELDVVSKEAKSLPKDADAAPKPIEETQSEAATSRSGPVGS
ncbi:MAG: Sec-independent protein translocase TatA [Phycisphaera sp.]|nr:MAG: Sec-independent protein translocase TatA [Phycisphaera sp.]